MKQIFKQTAYLLVVLLYGLYACKTLPTETRVRHTHEKEDKMRPDRPDLALLQDIARTKDPALDRVPYERRIVAFEYTRKKIREKAAIANVNWTERGPNNIGGRTRALMFDPNDAANGYKKVWAGGASGGLWFNNDITSASSSWQKVNDFWSNMAISCIAYDPSNTQIFYVGTGEGFFNADAVRGAGIWKTTDGGTTWNQLASTNNANFYYVQKIVVTSAGIVLAATRADSGTMGIARSTDGGANWVSTSTANNTDLEIAANGDVYRGNTTGQVFKSTNSGSTWANVLAVAGGRVELACAPSNSSVVYAVVGDGLAAGNIAANGFQKTTDAGVTWANITIPTYRNQNCTNSATHFTRGQSWYDLILAVHPTNPNIVIAGGIDLHRTLDGGATWTPASYWTGSCYSYVHADQHAIKFHPTDFNVAIFGHDGGVSYSANVGNSGATPVFSSRNTNYNVTQFYAVGSKNTFNSGFFVAGAQDNGSLVMNGFQAKPGREATGGDGAYCFVDQDDPNLVITAYTNNVVYLSTDAGSSFAEIISDANSGEFINPSEYDSQNNVFYSYKQNSPNRMYRVRNVGTTNDVDANVSVAYTGTYVSAIKMSPNTANTLFFGTDDGTVYRVAGANAGNWVATQIGGGALAAGTVSSIDVGATDGRVLVTISNYGVNSVFETTNAAANGAAVWTNKDNATLPDMPIRWGLYNRDNFNQVLLATEAGIYSTDDLNAANPTWGPSSTGLANVRCDMLKYRAADKVVVVGTHGRGIYTTDVFVTNPYADFETDKIGACVGSATINFTDGSLRATSWAWDMDDNGTVDYTTQNPTHTYTTAGIYTARLTINGGASTKTQDIVVATAPTTPSCTPNFSLNAGNANDRGIKRVQIGSIDNTTSHNDTGGTGYFDYTCSQMTTLTAGISTDITVTLGTLNAEGFTVFIDYNNDGTFQNSERLVSSAVNTTAVKTISFTPPTTGITLNTGLRMRVFSDNVAPATHGACTPSNPRCQAEDYTVVVRLPTFIWAGTTSSAWTTATNWSGGVVPTASDDVSIPSAVPNYPLVTSTVACTKLTIQSGATLNIGDNGVINKSGSFTNNGTVRLAGTTSQSVPSFMTTFNNLTIDNAGGAYLVQNIKLSGTLTIQSGTLNLSNYNIDLGTAGTLSENRAANAYILDNTSGLNETNKGGMIRATSRTTNGTLTQIAGMGIHLSNAGTVSIDRYHYRGSGFAIGGTIRKVYEVTGTPTNATMRIEYTAGERGGMAQNTTNVKLFRYNGTTWINQGGNWTSGTPAYAEATNINAFSPWTVGNSSDPLPITLLSFVGKRQTSEEVKLTWKTLNEDNNKGFEIERSIDATNFQRIGFVEGAGKVSTIKEYNYLDKFSEGAYYRFKQIDLSGTFSYSPMVFVEGAEPEEWKIYPNPTQGEVKVTIPRKALGQGKVTLRILTLNGQALASLEATPETIAEVLTQALKRLQAGSYLIEGKSKEERWQQKIIKQ